MKKIYNILVISLIAVNNYGQSKIAQFPDAAITYSSLFGSATGSSFSEAQSSRAKIFIYTSNILVTPTETWNGYEAGNVTDFNTPIDIPTLYNTYPSYINGAGVLKIVVVYYRCVFGCLSNQTNAFAAKTHYLDIYGGEKWVTNNQNFCAGYTYNLNQFGGFTNAPSNGTYSIVTPTPNASITSNVLNVVPTAAQNFNFQLKYEVDMATNFAYPGTASKQVTKTVNAQPNVVWVNPDIQNGQTILTSDPCINLSGTASCSNCTNFTYQSVGIANGTGTSFCPNISGGGAHAINAVGEITIGNATCVNQEYQLLNVTYDPGTPPLAVINPLTSGYTLGYSPTAAPPLNSQCMHVCDGQELTLRAGANLPAGINVVEYSYLENGNVHLIGEFPKNTNVTWPMPVRNSVRQDILRVRGKSTLGVFGSYNSIPVYVNMATKVVDQTILDTNCVTGGLVYDPVQTINNFGYTGSSLFWTDIGSEYADDYEFSNTDFRLFDELGNLYTANTMSGYTHTLTDKFDTLFLVSTTKIPFESQYRSNMTNPQSCVRRDTIIVVEKPTVSFTYNGDSIAEVGELYQFISSNTNHDYTTWNFTYNSNTYTGDTMFHYMNNMGYYNITCTAWDNFGCSASETKISVIMVGDWTSIAENDLFTEASFYPNPAAAVGQLQFHSKTQLISTLQMFDITGKLVKSEIVDVESGSNYILITLDDLTPGMYILSLHHIKMVVVKD